MACFTTTRCLVCIFLATPPMAPRADNLPLVRDLPVAGQQGTPGNLNAVPRYSKASSASIVWRRWCRFPCSPTAGPTSAAVLSLLNYLPNQQRFSAGLELPAIHFSESELSEPVRLSASWLSALRLSAVEKLCLCIRAAGKHHAGAGSRGRLRSQPRLQLQRRPSPQPSYQRQHHSR